MSASSQADQMRAVVPRYGGASEFDPEDSDYQMAIAVLAAVPIVLAVLTFVVGFFFCLCRCCSCIGLCHCCVRKPREEGYSKRARWVPWLFLALFGGVVFAMATYGMTENDKLSDTLTAPEGSGSSFVNFLPRVFDGVRGKIEELRGPILDMLDQLQPTVDSALDTINNSIGIISNGTDGLVDELNQFNTTWAGYVVTTPLATYACTYCTTVGTTMAELAVEIDDQTATMVADMQETVDSVESTLTSQVDEIRERITDINGTMDDAVDNVDDGEEVGDDIITALNEHDPTRHKATLYLYLVPLAGLALVLLGTLFKVGCLFKINVWIYFLATFVFWIMLAVYLPVAVVVGDACVYVEQEEAKLPTKTDDFSKVAYSCLANETTVLEALNVTDELDFADMIEFPTLPNVTEAFDFAAMTELQTEVDALTIDTFGWDDDALTAPIDAFNTAYGAAYVFAGFVDLDPNTEYPLPSAEKDDFIAAQGSVQDAIDSKQILEDAVAAMKADVESLTNTTDTMEADFTTAVADVEALEDLIQPFQDIADTLISRAECAFIGDLYRELNTLTCVNISTHFAVLAMTCFFIAFSGWWIITFSQISASRIPRPYNDDWDDAAKKEHGSQVEMRQIHVKAREAGTHHKH